ncbi:MAG: DUF4234 domain-containing protein [Lachnospiraceae bacterium]|nr:DUF4234 domain-containing protein [Lachnospiraceae bacterium]
MKICPKCGTNCGDDMRFCMNCGASLSFSQADAGATQETYSQTTSSDTYTRVDERGRNSYVRTRNIALCVILSIITCGIYGLYWMAVETDEMNDLIGDANETSGALAVIFTIITCGIYGLYWAYKMGEKTERLQGGGSNTGLMYLIISLIGLQVVNMCLIQDTINKTVR